MSIALIGGTLIDGNGGRPVPDAVVIVEGDRIQRAGPAAQMSTPADATTIDITGRTVMPGLVDAHIHICGEFASEPMHPLTQLPSYIPIRGVAAAGRLLDMGFTACRAMGDDHFANVALKQAIDLGVVSGPRMLTAGYMLTVIGNARTWVPPEAYTPNPGRFNGSEDGRRAVRINSLNGVDFIETQVAGAVGSNAPTPLEVTQ